MDAKERLLHLLAARSLKLGEFTLASGARSNYYVDARRTTMCAEGQFLLGRVGMDTIWANELQPSHVGGLTMGADPVAYAIAHQSWIDGHPLDAFSVRKQTKEHGTGQRIEGGLPDDATVLVIEDSITSGESSLKAIEAIEAHGCSVLGVLTLVDREEGGRERLKAAGYELYPIFTAQELLSRGSVEQP